MTIEILSIEPSDERLEQIRNKKLKECKLKWEEFINGEFFKDNYDIVKGSNIGGILPIILTEQKRDKK